jgi:hypothetical protein
VKQDKLCTSHILYQIGAVRDVRPTRSGINSRATHLSYFSKRAGLLLSFRFASLYLKTPTEVPGLRDIQEFPDGISNIPLIGDPIK